MSATTTQRQPNGVTGQTVAWVVGGALVVSTLAWIDLIFIPLVLLGPVVSGAIVGRRGGGRLPLAAAWFLSGIGMLVSDWVLNHEDQAFHLALAFVMAGLASGAHWVATRVARRR